MGGNMANKWIKTNFPGVRYREHPNRKHGIGPDKYFTIRYKLDGKDKEEGLGWSTEGWTAKKAAGELAELMKAKSTGEGPLTLQEKRDIAKTRREAEAADKERMARDAIDLEQIFENHYFPLAKLNKHPQSWKREKQLFQIWVNPVAGSLPLKDISPIHLERIKKNMLDAGRAARSVEYCFAVIRQVFNFAKKNGLYQGDHPISNVKKPKRDNKRLRFLTHEEAMRLLETLKAKSPQVYEMALLSLHAGMRAGEIFSLTWGDANLEQGFLTLRETKSGRNRVAFMTKAIKSMLSQKIRGHNDDLIFSADRPRRNVPNPFEANRKIQQISKTFYEAVEELKLNEGVTDPRQKVVFHSLRHTFASWLAEQGTDLYTIQTLMGHQSIAMVQRYSHLTNGKLQDAVKGLEKSLQRPEPGKVLQIEGR
jgi:integrase